MKLLKSISDLKKGQKLYQVEEIQGLNGEVESHNIYELEVEKVTKMKVHFINTTLKDGFMMRKEGYNAVPIENKSFNYGIRKALYI